MPTNYERAFAERPEVPDASYRDLDPDLRAALVVGRPIAGA